MGTAVGTKVFVQFGWRAAASVSMAWFGLQIVALLVRGPHVKRYTWFGYEGGLEARKSVIIAKEGERAENNTAAAIDCEQKEKDASVEKQHGSRPESLDATVEGEEHTREEKDPSQFV
jgi:hypothetical protein